MRFKIHRRRRKRRRRRRRKRWRRRRRRIKMTRIRRNKKKGNYYSHGYIAKIFKLSKKFKFYAYYVKLYYYRRAIMFLCRHLR